MAAASASGVIARTETLRMSASRTSVGSAPFAGDQLGEVERRDDTLRRIARGSCDEKMGDAGAPQRVERIPGARAGSTKVAGSGWIA